MNPVKAYDYPEVYEDLGIDTSKLGCIMVDTDPLTVLDIIKGEDLYFDPESDHVQGAVAESEAHVTLLYGLMRSGPELAKHVNRVFDLGEFGEKPEWFPTEVSIKEVNFFYGQDSEVVTIVALVDVSEGLQTAHQKLSLLPHINTFGEYKPHITLAYVKSSSDWEGYVKALNERYAGSTVNVSGINLGG